MRSLFQGVGTGFIRERGMRQIFLLIWVCFQVLYAQDCPDTRMLAVSRGDRPYAASDPQIISDGAGGFWMVYRTRGFDDVWSRLKVQRLNALGKPLLTEQGIELSVLEGDQGTPVVFADRTYGLTVVWQQNLSEDSRGDIYVQRIQPDGRLTWGKNGIQISSNGADQRNPVMFCNASGQIYIAWEDDRAGELLTDIYAQKIEHTGQILWAPEGVLVCRKPVMRRKPAMCEDTRGGVYILWEDYRSGTGWQLWFQSLTPEGISRYSGEGMPVLRPDASSQTQAKIIPDGFGGFFFVCEKMDVQNFETDIYFGRVNFSGQIVYQYPACTAFGEQRHPVLTVRNSEVILLWEDKRSGDWDIYGQYISIRNGGLQWEHNGLPLAAGQGDQISPDLMSTIEFNDLMFCWNSGDNVYVQKLNNFGEPVWKASGIEVSVGPAVQQGPRICRNGDGGCWLAWTDFRAGTKVFYQHINLSGLPLQKDQGVTLILDPEAGIGSGMENISILQSGADSVWIAWEDYRQGPNDPDIYLVKVGPDGESLFVDNGLPVVTENLEQTRPVMAPDLNGGVWIAWIDRRNGKDEDIYFQHYSPGGFPSFPASGKLLVSAPRSQAQLQIRPDGKGGFWAVWTDARLYDSQGFDIYLQAVSADGTLRYENGGRRITTGKHDSHTPVVAVGNKGELGLVWMDNRNGYFNLWFQVFYTSGTELFPGEGQPVSLAFSHQRQPALLAGEDGWTFAWSEERHGQARDKIYVLKMHSSGQIETQPDGLRVSTSPERQVRPVLCAGEEGEVLIAWQELHERSDEGVILRCRILPEGISESVRDYGRLVARLTQEKEGVFVRYHAVSSFFLLGWTEQKTLKSAVWAREPESRGAIPDQYFRACESRFEQRNVRVFPSGKGRVRVFWTEIRDAQEYLFQRTFTH